MKRDKNKLKGIFVLGMIILAIYFTEGGRLLEGWGEKFVKELASESSEETIKEKSSHYPKEIRGKIVYVPDGDTVTLEDTRGKKHRIRLNGIDCPEIGQEYGNTVREFVEKTVLKKEVKVDVIGVDQYDRILGVVHIGDMNVNETLLSNGLAWVYKYNDDANYKQLMQQAKDRKLNIWSQTNPLDPYIWRKQNKKK